MQQYHYRCKKCGKDLKIQVDEFGQSQSTVDAILGCGHSMSEANLLGVTLIPELLG